MEMNLREINNCSGPVPSMAALLLGFLSVYCLAIILERSWIHWRTRRRQRIFAARMKPLLDAGKWAEIVRMAKEARISSLPAGRALLAGLEAWLARESIASDSGLAWFVARDAMRRSAALSEAELKRGQRALIVSAVIALLMSLLVCVYGLFNAFNGLALTGDCGLTAISLGIAYALNTPAWGLLIALVAVLGHAWLATNIERTRIETLGIIDDLLNRLAQPKNPSAP
jgi:biopolymer transport protein ExbB/TolQ